MKKRFLVPFLLALLSCIAFPAQSFSQDESRTIDKSSIPSEAKDANGFVPPGWKIEEQVKGDLNNDSLPDYALKLVEDKPAEKDGVVNARERALVIVLKNRDGKFSRAAVADRLLQCTSCGGAFYGVMPAPANVTIEKGVLVVEQDHGSREVTDLTYRFRYEPGTRRFALIGFDISSRDRLTASAVAESSNYLTGVRTTYVGKGKRDKTTKKAFSKQKIYIEEVGNESFEEDAAKRLGL